MLYAQSEAESIPVRPAISFTSSADCLETGSQLSELLQTELKKWINVVIQNETLNCLESVQALLVIACYSAERSLMLSFATRMALDLGLDEAFEDLTHRLTMKDVEGSPSTDGLVEENGLMRKSRTWFGLLVLEHMCVLSESKSSDC